MPRIERHVILLKLQDLVMTEQIRKFKAIAFG
jgi:hypothetical protein